MFLFLLIRITTRLTLTNTLFHYTSLFRSGDDASRPQRAAARRRGRAAGCAAGAVLAAGEQVRGGVPRLAADELPARPARPRGQWLHRGAARRAAPRPAD